MGEEKRRLRWDDIAEMTGLAASSIHVYHNTSQKARDRARKLAELLAAGKPLPKYPGRLPKPGDLPPPDGLDYPPGRLQSGSRGPEKLADGTARRPSGAKTPYWHEETILAWKAQLAAARGQDAAQGAAASGHPAA